MKERQSMDINSLLQNAEKYLLEKDYQNAMRFYSLALNKDSNNKEAYIGILISDLGLDFTDEAQVLYYYYQSNKEKEAIVQTIEQLCNALYAKNSIYNSIFELIEKNLEYNDGIEYEDFLQLIKDKANFKEAFEDAIFSTKVIISKKWQFIDFIKKLTENGYYNVALNYLETHAPLYNNDQDILKLYALLPKNLKN